MKLGSGASGSLLFFITFRRTKDTNPEELIAGEAGFYSMRFRQIWNRQVTGKRISTTATVKLEMVAAVQRSRRSISN